MVSPCVRLRVPDTDYCGEHEHYAELGFLARSRARDKVRLDVMGKEGSAGSMLAAPFKAAGKKIQASIDADDERDRRIVCQFCHESSCVTTRSKRVKRGVSGGKATAAILTSGYSMLGVGLSRKQEVTELSCRTVA
jgi:hypothetical protein